MPAAKNAPSLIRPRSLCGWLYFLAWSLSFYPQLILNIRRRTTHGLTPDFIVLNVLGFTCYTVSTIGFLYSPVIRAQYAARHPLSPEPTVRFNDFAFGAHAWVLCVLVYSQFWPRLWGWEHEPSVRRHANKLTLGLIWGSLLGVAIVIVIVVAKSPDGRGNDSLDWAWIDVVRASCLGAFPPTLCPNYPRSRWLAHSFIARIDLQPHVRQATPNHFQIRPANDRQLPPPVHHRLVHRAATARL